MFYLLVKATVAAKNTFYTTPVLIRSKTAFCENDIKLIGIQATQAIANTDYEPADYSFSTDEGTCIHFKTAEKIPEDVFNTIKEYIKATIFDRDNIPFDEDEVNKYIEDNPLLLEN